MGVHLVLGPALPLHVLEREAGQAEAPAIGEDEACPRNEQAILPDDDLVVIGADEPRALGDEEQARDDRAGAQRVGRAGGLERGTYRRAARIARGLEERALMPLVALGRRLDGAARRHAPGGAEDR